MGRTLPPLFRTVRRVWQNSAKGWTSAEFCKSPKLEGSTEFCGRLNFCSTDFCETKADVSAEFCENVYFLFGRFLRNKGAGLALALIWDISPLSVCGFLLMCCFLACKGVCLALILLLRVCRVKRADVAIISPYSTLQSLYSF